MTLENFKQQLARRSFALYQPLNYCDVCKNIFAYKIRNNTFLCAKCFNIFNSHVIKELEDDSDEIAQLLA